MEIKSSPSALSSANGDLVYVVHSPKAGNPTTYPSYKYIADIYVNSALVARVLRVPDPVNDFGVFNVGQIVRNYLKTSFAPVFGQLVAQTLGNEQHHVPLMVKFGEQYNRTNYTSILTSPTVKVYNHYNLRAKHTLGDKLALVASDRPLYGSILGTSDYYLIPYFPNTGNAVNVTVTPDSGTPYSGSFTPASLEMQVLNLAPGNLNTLQPGTITEQTTSYTAQVGSQTIRMKVACEKQYTPHVVHFLNRYGAFESFLFQKVSRTTYDVEKRGFGKLPYVIDSSGQVSYKTGNVYHEGPTTFASELREKLLVNSDIVTDQEHTWLADLVFSPLVYVEVPSKGFYPARVSETNYEPKKATNDGLTNITLSIEFGQNLNAQYR